MRWILVLLVLVFAVPCPADVVSYEDLIQIVDLSTSGQYDYDGVAQSPDSQLVVVETRRQRLDRNATEIRWKIVELRGPTVIDGGDGGEPIPFEPIPGLINGNSLPQRPQWSPDSRWFVFRAKYNGEVQLWKVRRDGQEQQRLTTNPSDVTAFHWADRGDKIFFEVGSPRSVKADAMRDEAARGFLYDDRFAPAHGSTKPILTRSSSPESKSVWIYDVLSGTERLASEAEKLVYQQMTDSPLINRPYAKWVRRSKNTAAIAWLDSARTGAIGGIDPPLTVMSSATSDGHRPVICKVTACTGYFKGLWTSDDGKSVYFLRWMNGYDYGRLALYKWDVGVSNVIAVLETDDLLEACTYMRQSLTCVHESSTTPAKLVSVALSTGVMRVLYDPNPRFQSLVFGETTPLTWRDHKGVEGFGHLVKPIGYESTHRYPLVIVQYRSSGFLRGGIGDEYPIHVLASKGFMVLSFDRPRDREKYRNAKNYEELDRKLWNDLTDRRFVLSVLEAGIDSLKAMGFIDPKRVGITGLSDGGNTGVFALIHSPQRFAAAALSYTRWNPIYYYLAGPNAQRSLDRWGLGNPNRPLSGRQWADYSIGLNASRVLAPLLIQVSDAEFLTETQTWVELKNHGKPVELYVYPDEHHIKSQPIHRFYIYKRNVQWFLFWLREIEETDPIDATQYQRWRALRELKGEGAAVSAR